MSKRANPTTIGIFVIAGIALIVTGVLLFASTKFFSRKTTFIAYFSGSVNGLDIGSPVKFKGVPIGKVSRIAISFNQIATEEPRIPVFLEIDEDVLSANVGGEKFIFSEDVIDQAIQNGLRAKLETQSILTGLLYVDLDIYPNAAPPEFFQEEPKYLEIPTTPSVLARLVKSLGDIDLAEVSRQIQSILGRLDRGLSTIEFQEINQRVMAALESLNRLVDSPDLKQGLADIRAMSQNANALLTKVDGKIEPLAAHAQKSLEELSATLQELHRVAQDMESLIAPDAPLTFEINQALTELSTAARSIRVLAEYLARNPNAILTGKNAPDTK